MKALELNLKKVTESDIPILLALEKSVAGAKTYSAMLSTEEWQDELKNNEVFLIEQTGQPVGSIMYEIKSPERAYLSGLVIDPRFQGQGLGRQALELVLGQLKDFKRIDLVTHPDNSRALKLYQSLGFVVEARKENYFGDGEPRFVLALVK